MQFSLMAVLIFLVVMSVAWLSMVPFSGKMHVPVTVYYVSLSVYCLCMTFILAQQNDQSAIISSDSVLLISVTLMIVLIMFGLFAMRERFLQYVFVLFFVLNFYDDAQVLARILTARIMSVMSGVSYLLVLDVLLAAVLIPLGALLCTMLKRLVMPAVRASEGKPMWHYQWAMPIMFDVIYRMRIFPDYKEDVIEGTVHDLIILALWILFELAVYSIHLSAMLRSAKSAAFEQQLAVSKLQTEMQRSQYDALQRNIERTRRTAHDLRHHFIVLDSLAEQGDCGGIRKYLKANSTNFGEPEMPPVCDNYSVNSVLCHHISEARKQGAVVKTNLQIPRNLGDVEGDVSIVISNLVENAVEACNRMIKGDRFIEISAAPVSDGKMLAVTVSNSYSGEIQSRNGRFVSAKEDNRMGVGTESVRSMVETRGGICSYTYGDGVFTASALIKLDEVKK